MDGISAAASIAALVHIGRVIYGYSHDAFKDRTQRARFAEVVEHLITLLELLKLREHDARQKPSDPWYQGFLALVQSASMTPSASGKLVPDPTSKGDGILRRLTKAMTKMKADLETQHGFFKRTRQRLRWSFDKEKFRELLDEIEEWRLHVDSMLNQDHFALSLSIRNVAVDTRDHVLTAGKVGEDTNNRVKTVENAVGDTNSRLKTAETTHGDTNNRVQGMETVGIDTNNRIRALEEKEEKKEREEERKAIIAWLSPLEFRKRQSEIFNQSIQTGQTLLKSPVFQAWISGRPWILYCYGVPGAGKTVLSSIVVDHLKNRFINQNVPVLCMYLNYKESRVQTLENLIGSLLKQLVQYQEEKFQSAEVKRLFREAQNEARITLNELDRALRSEIMAFERVVLVVDALDEASLAIQSSLLDALQSFPSDKLNVMITSRPIDEGISMEPKVFCSNCGKRPLKLYFNCGICQDGNFDLCQNCKDNQFQCEVESHTLSEPYSNREINIEPSEEEIKHYVEWVLHKELRLGTSKSGDRRLRVSQRGTTPLGRLCRKDPKLKDKILSVVVARANGMFMLANLYMNSLKVKLSVSEVMDTLENLPNGYYEMYEKTMERIDVPSLADRENHSSSLAKKVLSWVACAYRPLSLLELQDALAVDLEKPDPKTALEYDKITLLEITAGLFTVDPDEKAVRLVHFTAQEYFNKHRDRWFPNASANIAQACLHYLSHQDLLEPCQGIWEDKEFETRKRGYPFLSYAYQHWGDHAHNAGSDSATEAAVLQFASNPKRIASFIQAAWYLDSTDATNWDIRKGASSLHVCAWFGLTNVVSKLLHQGLEINCQDPIYGQTPLMYACRRGHVATAIELLSRGASLNTQSTRGSTAMFEAVIKNRVDVARTLLARKELEINASQPMIFDRTVLMIAAQEEYVSIIDDLLNREDLKINQKDLQGNTALSIATKSGSSAVVSILLANKSLDLDIDSKNENGNTALILAAKSGLDDIADQLLARGADFSIKDYEGGGTALMRAVDNGQISTVETMLTHNVETDCLDDLGRGLLHSAAANDNGAIVCLLVDIGLDKDAQDKKGRTPLHDASRYGQPEIAKLLLDLGANPSIKDESGRTPWTVAWQNGEINVMKILEGKENKANKMKSDQDSYPNAKALPVWSAVKLGRRDLVSSMIAEGKDRIFHIDPDSSDTALHCAVACNQPEVLQILLEASVSPDSVNDYFRTPLHLAALYGNTRATTILLNHHAQLNMRDKWGATALFIAQAGNYVEVALLLIEAEALIDQKILVQPMFFAAVEHGRKKAVEILIRKGADVLKKNLSDQTALDIAKTKGFGEIMQVLRQNKSFYQPSRNESPISDEHLDENGSFVTSSFRKPEMFQNPEALMG